jgi:hypothetical protein
MNELKKFLIEEIETAIKKENKNIRRKELTKDLYESVNLQSELYKKLKNSTPSNQSKTTLKKYNVAKKVTELLESKLKKLREDERFEGEGKMIKAQLLSIMENAERLFHMIDENDTYEDWLQSKLTIAEDYLRSVSGYIKYYNQGDNMKPDYDEDEYDDLDYDDEDLDWDDVEEDELDYDFDDEDFDDEDLDGEDWDDDDE